MAWFTDLAPCSYFGEVTASRITAVGWLEQGRSFPIGPVDHEIYDKLVELLKSPWQLAVSAGGHSCDLCQYDGLIGMANLFVPGENTVFVCPELIAHYMNAHQYRPPEEFCRAVLSCPEMRSMSYLRALRVAGLSLAKSLAD